MTLGLSTLLVATLPFFLAVAAISDARRYIIPNWTCAALIGAFFLCAPLAGYGLEAIAEHLAVGVAGLLVGFALFAVGVWGGGDGKLLAATALWFDGGAVTSFLLNTAIVGGVIGVVALAAIAFHARIGSVFGVDNPALARLRKAAPYGVAIAIGAVLAFPEAEMFRAVFYG